MIKIALIAVKSSHRMEYMAQRITLVSDGDKIN